MPWAQRIGGCHSPRLRQQTSQPNSSTRVGRITRGAFTVPYCCSSFVSRIVRVKLFQSRGAAPSGRTPTTISTRRVRLAVTRKATLVARAYCRGGRRIAGWIETELLQLGQHGFKLFCPLNSTNLPSGAPTVSMAKRPPSPRAAASSLAGSAGRIEFTGRGG